MNIYGRISLLCLCGLSLCGCRKDLCYDHDMHGLNAQAQVTTSWECAWERPYEKHWRDAWSKEFGCTYESLCPEPATGVASVVYHADGTHNERHLSGEGGLLPMREGRHSILFYNDDTNYIVFCDMESCATASVTTRTRTRSTYSEMHSNETTVNTPDILYGAWVESFEAVRSETPAALPIEMKPLVYTYLIRYEFEQGWQYAALARGALSGMAESVFLRDGRTGNETATVLFDCTIEEFGAQAIVTSFGAPGFVDGNYTHRDRQHYGLNLEVRMKNGHLKTFEIDVTDQVEAQPRGGVIVVEGLSISEGEGGGEAGFDVDVDGWGDYEDIELPL